MRVFAMICAAISGLAWCWYLTRLLSVAANPSGGLAAIILEIELGVSTAIFLISATSASILHRLDEQAAREASAREALSRLATTANIEALAEMLRRVAAPARQVASAAEQTTQPADKPFSEWDAVEQAGLAGKAVPADSVPRGERRCPHCRERIGDTRTSCPHCGGDATVPFKNSFDGLLLVAAAPEMRPTTGAVAGAGWQHPHGPSERPEKGP